MRRSQSLNEASNSWWERYHTCIRCQLATHKGGMHHRVEGESGQVGQHACSSCVYVRRTAQVDEGCDHAAVGVHVGLVLLTRRVPQHLHRQARVGQ